MMKTSTTINIRKKSAGFTIVELLLVALIITLLATAAGGIYVGTYRKMAVEKCAKEIMLAAKYARIIAIDNQVQCKLVLDKDNNRFCLTAAAPDEAADEESETVISNQYTRPGQFSGDVKFEVIKIMPTVASLDDSEVQGVIVFKPNGTADTAIVQIGDGKNHYTVYILAATGKAKVQFGQAEENQADIIDLDLVEE